MGDLDAAQRRILETVGWGGIEPEKLLRDGRDFQEVERRGLVVFWPFRGERPRTIYGGAITPGRWYLTVAGAAAIGLDSTPLRLS